MSGPTCTRCEKGTLTSQKVYRNSGPVVVIGFILLALSLAALAGSVIYYYVASARIKLDLKKHEEAAQKYKEAKETAAQNLKKADVPQAVIDKVVGQKDLAPEDLSDLTEDQKKTVRDAQGNIGVTFAIVTAHAVGTALGGIGVAVGHISLVLVTGCVGFLAFVGALLGLLLVLKKKVIQCDQCGAPPDDWESGQR